MRVTIALLITLTLAAGAAADGLDQWPPTDYLVRSIVERVPDILKAYHPETGRFGTEPWICGDQDRIFALAAAWSYEHPANPYYHSDEVLAAVAGGGVALVEAQDELGRWRFDKKDGSYWGQTFMAWTYSSWIRTYVLVRDALPDDVRATWERGLLLGYRHIAEGYPQSGVHNIPVHLAASVFIAGVAFDNEDWQRRAREFMPKAVAAQDPAGFWSEHQGPVVMYNYVYSEALGFYYHFAQDPQVLEALRRAAHFHSAILWPDGSSVSCIDERNTYSSAVRMGNPGFAHTPEGRGYLLAQLRRYAGETMRTIGADMAAALLLYGSDGDVIMPEELGEDGVVTLGDNDALIRRTDAWCWALSGYAAEVPNNRWIQDRQNLMDVFHPELGLVAGGGNTKLQPYWSTFTVGDVSLLAHTPGDEDPDFAPDIDLAWAPNTITLDREGDTTRLEATFIPRTRLEGDDLLSEGFEQAAAGGLPDGWSVFSNAGTMAVAGEQASEGKQALRFIDDGDHNSLGLRSPRVEAEAGALYYAEAGWLAESGNEAVIYLEFWNAAGERMQEGMGTVSVPGRGEWVRRSVTSRAPEGAVGVTTLLYSAIASTTSGHFDQVVLGRFVPGQEVGESARCTLDVRTDGDDLLLTYRGTKGVGAQAHLPLLLRGSRLDLATGSYVPLLEDLVELTSAECGDWITHSNLRVSVPKGASIRWPARQHNPYAKDGRSGLNEARIVLVMPFDDTDEYTVRLSPIKPEPFNGTVLEARDLPFENSEGTYTKRLDDLGSMFIGSTKPGSWLRFTLPEIEPGRYELIGEFVVASSYGIVEILLDGEVIGDPFDGYWAGVDGSGTRQSFGEVDLGGGPHEVTVRIIGKNPASSNQIFSVKRWLLRPVK